MIQIKFLFQHEITANPENQANNQFNECNDGVLYMAQLVKNPIHFWRKVSFAEIC